MASSKDLSHLLGSMTPVLLPKTYVFLTVKPGEKSPDVEHVMRFDEAEGVTLIAEKTTVEESGHAYEFPCRMITLNIHSSLEAVGFLAVITTHLAKLGVGVNPVSGFYHDHLFIPADRADDVMTALVELSASHR